MARLVILLWSMQSNQTLYRLEGLFGWAKSSINRDKYHLGRLLLNILQREAQTLWPNHEDQLVLISLLPDSLRATNIFFIVDSTKLKNNDSIDVDTRRRHWNNHKGFGCHMIMFCDLFGNVIWFEPMRDGNGADVQQYRSSAPFQQLYGCTFVETHTGMGDTAYVTASSNRPMSAALVQKFNLGIIADPVFLELAIRHNKDFDVTRSGVERLNRGVKRFSVAGHQSKISLLNNSIGPQQ